MVFYAREVIGGEILIYAREVVGGRILFYAREGYTGRWAEWCFMFFANDGDRLATYFFTILYKNAKYLFLTCCTINTQFINSENKEDE